jgi:hypothetical protein
MVWPHEGAPVPKEHIAGASIPIRLSIEKMEEESVVDAVKKMDQKEKTSSSEEVGGHMISSLRLPPCLQVTDRR